MFFLSPDYRTLKKLTAIETSIGDLKGEMRAAGDGGKMKEERKRISNTVDQALQFKMHLR